MTVIVEVFEAMRCMCARSTHIIPLIIFFDLPPPHRTPYTHVPRHTYVDPDYTYNDEERKRHKQHKDSYVKLIRERHSERMWKERERWEGQPQSSCAALYLVVINFGTIGYLEGNN